jgi:hypothetical protein
MKTGGWWVGLVMNASLAVVSCSGRLDYEPAEYQVMGAGGAGGSSMPGNNPPVTPPNNTPPATGGAGGGGAGGGGAGGGGAGGSGGASAAGGTGGSSQQPPKSDAGIGAEAASGPETAPPVTSTCPPGKDALAVIAARCGSCHGQTSPTKGLDVVTPGLAARLVGVKSACGGRPFLETTGTAGYFLDKLDGPVAGCGGQMPFGAPPLTPDERGCIEDWARLAIARGVSGR